MAPSSFEVASDVRLHNGYAYGTDFLCALRMNLFAQHTTPAKIAAGIKESVCGRQADGRLNQ